MNDYNQVQVAYRQKCTERIQRQLEISTVAFRTAHSLCFACFCFLTFVHWWTNTKLDPHLSLLAGRSVTEGEVEEMLESGNPAVFTQGVRICQLTTANTTFSLRWMIPF